MVILIDMDDTIEHLLVPWLEYLNRRHGKNVKESDVVSWNMHDSYPDLTDEQIYSPLNEDEFWDTVTPIDGAVEAVERLIKKGHQVYIVTATPYQSVQAKMERVLFRYFPFITWEQVIITSRKQMIRGDVLIDDGIHNLEGGDYKKIMFTAPHNRHYDAEANGMIRVNTWDEVVRIIDGTGGEKAMTG